MCFIGDGSALAVYGEGSVFCVFTLVGSFMGRINDVNELILSCEMLTSLLFRNLNRR